VLYSACIGEVAYIKQELQHDGSDIVRAYQIQDGMKTCIFDSVKSALLTLYILLFFTGLLVKVVGFDENDLELAQHPILERVIKLLVIEINDMSAC
jgi:hypothetical protein